MTEAQAPQKIQLLIEAIDAAIEEAESLKEIDVNAQRRMLKGLTSKCWLYLLMGPLYLKIFTRHKGSENRQSRGLERWCDEAAYKETGGGVD